MKKLQNIFKNAFLLFDGEETSEPKKEEEKPTSETKASKLTAAQLAAIEKINQKQKEDATIKKTPDDKSGESAQPVEDDHNDHDGDHEPKPFKSFKDKDEYTAEIKKATSTLQQKNARLTSQVTDYEKQIAQLKEELSVAKSSVKYKYIDYNKINEALKKDNKPQRKEKGQAI